MKRLFKKTRFKASDNNKEYDVYTPTVYKKGAVKISDSFRKKQRQRLGGFDNTFTIPVEEANRPNKKITKSTRRAIEGAKW